MVPRSLALLVGIVLDVLTSSTDLPFGSDCRAELYGHGNFSGWRVLFPVGEYDHKKMTGMGAKRGELNAMKVIGHPSCKAEVYGGDFKGKKTRFDPGDYPHSKFVKQGHTKDLSSIKVWKSMCPRNYPKCVDGNCRTEACRDGGCVWRRAPSVATDPAHVYNAIFGFDNGDWRWHDLGNNCTSDFEVQASYTFLGDGFCNDKPGGEVDSLDGCAQRCQNLHWCRGFSYKPSPASSSAGSSSMCYLTRGILSESCSSPLHNVAEGAPSSKGYALLDEAAWILLGSGRCDEMRGEGRIGDTLSGCAQRCREEHWCQTFSYSHALKQCELSDSRCDSRTDSQPDDFRGYAIPKLPWKHMGAGYCNFTYNRAYLRESLSGCALRCKLTNWCRSFSYSKTTHQCDLSGSECEYRDTSVGPEDLQGYTLLDKKAVAIATPPVTRVWREAHHGEYCNNFLLLPGHLPDGSSPDPVPTDVRERPSVDPSACGLHAAADKACNPDIIFTRKQGCGCAKKADDCNSRSSDPDVKVYRIEQLTTVTTTPHRLLSWGRAQQGQSCIGYCDSQGQTCAEHAWPESLKDFERKVIKSIMSEAPLPNQTPEEASQENHKEEGKEGREEEEGQDGKEGREGTKRLLDKGKEDDKSEGQLPRRRRTKKHNKESIEKKEGVTERSKKSPEKDTHSSDAHSRIREKEERPFGCSSISPGGLPANPSYRASDGRCFWSSQGSLGGRCHQTESSMHRFCPCYGDPCRAEVFEHGDFSGWMAKLLPGPYDNKKFESEGAHNNQVSSIKVYGDDCTAVLYEHGDFSGWSVAFTVGAYDSDAFFAKGAKKNGVSAIKVVKGSLDQLFSETPAYLQDPEPLFSPLALACGAVVLSVLAVGVVVAAKRRVPQRGLLSFMVLDTHEDIDAMLSESTVA